MTFHRKVEDERPKWLRWFLFKEPSAASGEWWDKRHEMLSRRAPLRYFLQNDLPHLLRMQGRKAKDAIWWFRYRTTDRHHVVPTGLKPGFHEVENRMLYANFSLLVEYVEVGLASKNYDCADKDPKVRGLQYLDWEIKETQCSQEQRDTAQAVRMLYLWWTVERPQRLEPWAAPEIWGEPKSNDDPPEKFSLFGLRSARRRFSLGNRKRSRIVKEAAGTAAATEAFYAHQDTGMLLKLVELRSSLWT